LVRTVRRHRLLLASAILVCGMVWLAGGFLWQERRDAKQALHDAQQMRRSGNWENALTRVEQGLEHARAIPGCADLHEQLEREWWAAKRDGLTIELHQLAEQMRFCHDPDGLQNDQALRRAIKCREIWDSRERLLDDEDGDIISAERETVLLDLHDVALLGL